jgi:uncharacterized membrane protein YfcA
MFLGAYGGAMLAQTMSEVALKRAFAVVLLIVAGRLWMTT